jgi:fatty-acid desaturase
MSGPQILAAVLVAFVVTQISTVTIIVLAHGALRHRALKTQPSSAFLRRSSSWFTAGTRAVVSIRRAHICHDDVHLARAA